MSPKIVFKKPDLAIKHGELDASEGTLMDVLLANGLPVASSCGGDGVCTKCRIHVKGLEAGATSEATNFERGLLRKINADPDERISCQTKVLGSIEVDAAYW